MAYIALVVALIYVIGGLQYVLYLNMGSIGHGGYPGFVSLPAGLH